MLAEEIRLVLDDEDPLWRVARPLLDAILHLEESRESDVWYGWQKSQVSTFLAKLLSPCSLVVGVWDTIHAMDNQPAQDKLVLGAVCGVENGTVCSIGSFETLVSAGMKSVDNLEIGMEDALEIMHYARKQFAPVAWALFIEKSAWDEWLFTAGEDGAGVDKGKMLRQLVHLGRCVLMGSQAALRERERTMEEI